METCSSWEICHVMNMPHNSFIAECMVTYTCMCSQWWVRNYALSLIANMAMSCHAPTNATQLVQNVCGYCDLQLCCVCIAGSEQLSFLLVVFVSVSQHCTFSHAQFWILTASGQCKPPGSDRLDTLVCITTYPHSVHTEH